MKNLVFLFADQWRRSAVGIAKEDAVYTPNIDALAKEGVYCTNAVSSCPLCSPHRASLFTGRYPLSTGVFTNCKTGLDIRLQDSEVALGDVLKQNGYSTGYIGKWHLDEPEQNHCLSPQSGATGWDAYTPPSTSRHGFDYWHSYGANDEHLTPHYWENSPQQIKTNIWSTEHETDKAIEFIQRQSKDKPFSLVVSYNPPHSPYDLVPQKYFLPYENQELIFRENVLFENLHCHTGEQINYTKDELTTATKQYFAAVNGLDEQVGRIVQYLKQNNLYENTCIVVSADHGDMLGSHGLMAKHVWYEESIGIPLIFAGSELTSGVCESVIGSADIMPTLLQWLNIPCPITVQGQSKLANIRQHAKADNSATFICACPGRDVFLKAFSEAGLRPIDFGWRAIRTQTHTYVIEIGYETTPCTKRYLYDLISDPYQKKPLLITINNTNVLAKALDAKLLTYLNEQKDGFVNFIDKEKQQGVKAT